MFLPSTYPSLLNSRRNDSAPVPGPPPGPEGVRAPSQPILGIFECCCAMAGEQSARSIAPTRANFGFLILDFRLSDGESLCRLTNILFMFLSFLSSNPKSKIGNLKSFNHLVRAEQHRLRDCQVEGFCGL